MEEPVGGVRWFLPAHRHLLVGEGLPDVSCERRYLKPRVLGERGKGTPLRGGSYLVNSWVRVLASRETPARVQGAQGSRFPSGSATLRHETTELKTMLKLSWADRLFLQMRPREEEKAPGDTQLVGEIGLGGFQSLSRSLRAFGGRCQETK